MSRRLKFAAALLVLLVFAVPSFAVVTCIGGPAPASTRMHCPAGCPMMAEANPAPVMQLSATQHSGAPCCKVSNAKPSPSAVPQAPVTGASIASQGVSTAPGLVPAPFLVRRQQARSVRLPESPQSLLCVFLI
jgi:hypothetical protein